MARIAIPPPMGSSAPRSGSSAIASTDPIGFCIQPFAKDEKAKGASSASPGMKPSSSSSTGCSERKRNQVRESILPYSYGGSNGLMTQDNFDAKLWRRLGTSRLARTLCAAPTGAANMALYGKMASVGLRGLPRGTADHPVGRESDRVRGSSRSRTCERRKSAAPNSIVIDPRSTQLARAADIHLAVKPGTDVAVALAIHRYLFANGFADEAFLARTREMPSGCASAPTSGRSSKGRGARWRRAGGARTGGQRSMPSRRRR